MIARHPADREPEDLNDIISEIDFTTRLSARHSNVRIVYDLSGSLLSIRGDPIQMRQVIAT